MRVHILGICGTFMSGVALLAKEAGHQVTGCDEKVYPPVSEQLKSHGIEILEGYTNTQILDEVDQIIVGNVIKRGNPSIEYVLRNRLSFTSGPQWLAEHVLRKRWVLAVAGTHGKTTTTSILAWILHAQGLNPGFLIGGVAQNFGKSANLGHSPFFVIEADEYDTAFFDKRSKFIHYLPKTVILNNLEYDHADIFSDVEAIKRQFHFLLRTIQEDGLILQHKPDPELDDVLHMGCWSEVQTFGQRGNWQAQLLKHDGSEFSVTYQGESLGTVRWQLLGTHNVSNALAAIAAAKHAGIDPSRAIACLKDFKNVKRRLEMIGKPNNISIYDDFAHHPTAIATTLKGLRAKIGQARLIAVLEFGSYTMRTGAHKNKIIEALECADMVACKNTANDWGLNEILQTYTKPYAVYPDEDSLITNLSTKLRCGDHVVIMSNTGFGGIHGKLIDLLENSHA